MLHMPTKRHHIAHTHGGIELGDRLLEFEEVFLAHPGGVSTRDRDCRAAGAARGAVPQSRITMTPQHPEALMHLAALLASQGDEAGARRLQERAARNERTADSERKR